MGCKQFTMRLVIEDTFYALVLYAQRDCQSYVMSGSNLLTKSI